MAVIAPLQTLAVVKVNGPDMTADFLFARKLVKMAAVV
jgi:hypothetical protein